ncbi:MAG TPA: site-specific integrase [Pseudoxanthomonas sp.]|nr:site-specific integrase [Pseudoxanthomonas sp.]
MGQQAPQEALLDVVLVRYWEQHGRHLPSAEMTRIALGYWSDFFPGATVAEVTPGRQREFIGWLRKPEGKPPRSDGYIKRVLTVGKSALNRAYKEGEIATVPYILPGEDSPPRDLVLSVEDSAALWRAARLPHEQMMLALLYGTLARPEAALALHREFTDFERRLLTTNPPGRKQTKKYRPVVPVCDFLLPWLANAPSGPLVAWRGQEVDSFKTAWRRMRRDAGLPVQAVPKTIRHTMATELRAAGVPEAEIQGFMGHRAYSGKTEVYAKYRPDYLGEAARAIDGYMARVRASCVLADPASGNETGPSS